MKRFLNGLYIAAAVLAGLWLSAEIFLHFVFPLPPVQRFTLRQVSKLAGRPVEAGRISVRWRGIALRDVRVAGGADWTDEDLFAAQNVRVTWAPWHLLHGHIKVRSVRLEKPRLYLTRDENGILNSEGLFGSGSAAAPETKKEKKPFPWTVTAGGVYVTGGEFTFNDLQNKRRTDVRRLFVSARNVRTDAAFPVSVNADVRYTRSGRSVQHMRLGVTLWPDLKKLDTAQAAVKLTRAVLKHPGGVLVVSGEAAGLEKPVADLQLSGHQLSDELLSFFSPGAQPFYAQQAQVRLAGAADLAAQTAEVFSFHTVVSSVTVYSSSSARLAHVPELSLYAAGRADWDKRKINISSFTVQGLSSFVSGSGSGKLAGKPIFSAEGAFGADLQALSEGVAVLEPYQLTGEINGTAGGTQNDVSAQIDLQGVGAALPAAGTLSDFTARAEVPDRNHVNIKKFAGKLNGGAFGGSLFARLTENGVDVDLKARSARIALPPLKEKATADEAEPVVPVLPSSPTASSFSLPPFNVRAAVDIASLDAPFIFGEDISFRADIRKLSPELDRAQGTLSFSTGKGEIKDLNKLTNANLLTGVLFGSLSVVSKVINSMNLLAVIESLGDEAADAVSDREPKPADMVVQTVKDEKGRDVQILVPYDAGKIDGIWAFEQFGTDIIFEDGVADVTKGSFVSDLMSFNLRGDMNFKTRGLDMTVQAAPGRHYEGGIMPLTVDISGTLDNPSGSVSLASSLVSLLTQGVGNNFASRSVKKGLGGLFGLFKKKKPAKEPVSSLQTGEHSWAEKDASIPQEP